MTKFKKCRCGKIYYEDENNEFPDICINQNCQALLIDFDCVEDEDIENVSSSVTSEADMFYFVNEELHISIPIKEDATVGRGINCLGHEQLKFNAISREHIKVKIINKFMLEIEDVSRFGTKINGKIMIKGIPQKLSIGDTISLYEYNLKLERK